MRRKENIKSIPVIKNADEAFTVGEFMVAWEADHQAPNGAQQGVVLKLTKRLEFAGALSLEQIDRCRTIASFLVNTELPAAADASQSWLVKTLNEMNSNAHA